MQEARAKAGKRTVFAAPYATRGKKGGKRTGERQFVAGETCTVIGTRADAVLVETEDDSRIEIALPYCLYGSVWKFKE